MNDLQKLTASAIVNVFETGRVRGDYGAIAVLKGDSGHLSYGRSQAALGAGTLFDLLALYCQQPGGQFTAEVKAILPRVQKRDVSLDQDTAVHDLLKRAGRQDPVMRFTQDQFFNARYLGPACSAAEAFGVTLALGQAVIYDSHIQGGWKRLKDRIGPVKQGNEKQWTADYLKIRRDWLLSLDPPVPNTVYRVDSFKSLADGDKWELPLPISVHGVTITAEALTPDLPVGGAAPRTLRLASPYLRGEDVRAVQRELAKNAFTVGDDGVYGPFTAAVVKAWQTSQSIVEDGVGPLTRKSLGLP